MVHELKTESPWFERVRSGEKTAELRRDDRDFQLGDELHLRHWNPETATHTGPSVRARITHVLRNPHGDLDGLDNGFAILSIVLIDEPKKAPPAKKAAAKKATTS